MAGKLKMVIVMRTDLNMRKGKMIAQGAHAATMPFLVEVVFPDGDLKRRDRLMQWISDSHMTKITLRVGSEEELLDIYNKADDAGLDSYIVTDAGFTEFHGVPTKTCISIGPNLEDEIDLITGQLKLL